MGVDQDSPFARHSIGIAQQTLGARKYEARRQSEANATLRSLVPLFVERLAFNKCLPRRLQQPLRSAIPGIHEAFPDDGAQPASPSFVKYHVRLMNCFHR